MLHAFMAGRTHPDFARIRPPLEGRLVRLRALEESDIPRWSGLFNEPDVLYHLDAVVFPQPEAATRRYWEESRGEATGQVFAVETLSGEFVGAMDLRDVSDRSRTATLGIALGKPYWGQGYGTDAVRVACRFAFREMNLQRVELHVHETNPRGLRAYARVGFKEEGRLRRAHFVDGHPVDVIVMGLLAEELVEDESEGPPG
jgi:RimJ/RimL family protein N-acetyltransferase